MMPICIICAIGEIEGHESHGSVVSLVCHIFHIKIISSSTSVNLLAIKVGRETISHMDEGGRGQFIVLDNFKYAVDKGE